MWEANPNVLTTDLGDELVLMDPHRSVMFSLNASGRLVWQALPAGVPQLAELLVGTYGLSAETAQADVLTLLGQLQERGLVRSQ